MPKIVLNDTLLGTCIGIAIACVGYLFFWNRILGLVVSLLGRIFLWTQDPTASWVDVGSVHLSLISGKILLRDVRYHSSNQTFRIVKCQLSWRWWLRVAAEEEDLVASSTPANGNETDGQKGAACRIHASLEGFEWFLYNRTASFDAILIDLLEKSEYNEIRSRAQDSHLSHPRSSFVLGPDTFRQIKLPPFLTRFYKWLKTQLPDLDPKHLLPLSVEISKAAITLGNHTTESLLLVQFVRATGTYGIVQARSNLDLYRQLLRMSFDKPKISLLENPDCWAPAQDIGKNVVEIAHPDKKEGLAKLVDLNFRKAWSRRRKFFKYFRKGRYDKARPKKERAPDDEAHIGADFSELEYAKDRIIVDTPSIQLLYTADVAGTVPQKPHNRHAGRKGWDANTGTIEFLDIGNGDVPPEWKLELVVNGGNVHYGPWADRQRVQLQRIFFPAAFHDIDPFPGLLVGDTRTCTCFKMFFELRDNTTLVIPFRESSKNWQWDGEVDVPRASRKREAAQLQIRLGDKSTVQYLVPMLATTKGYIGEFRTFLESIAVGSSLNDIALLEANKCSVSALLPSPLHWDAERTWIFDIDVDAPVLYLIRDHINMLTDLGKDWASGPPNDFQTYVPMVYGINLTLTDYELNLYANDHNIIDRPLDRRDNVLFTLKSGLLKSAIGIPSNVFRPFSTTITFSVLTDNVALGLTLPKWNTHALTDTIQGQLQDFGHVSEFRLEGTYTYFAEVREGCADLLKLDMSIPSPALKLYGWLIRHVMVLRDNYFGTFTQYSTTKEYLAKRDDKIYVGDPLDSKYRPGKNNAFHFELSLFIDKPVFALPASVLGFERTARGSNAEDIDMGSGALLTTTCLQLQLRLHQFYMELALNIDPIGVSLCDTCPNKTLFSHKSIPTQTHVRIKNVDIVADRLFGPQPYTSTYVCVWKINVGKIVGAVTLKQLRLLSAVAASFGQGYSDAFNAPAKEFVVDIDRDATFLNVSIADIDFVLKAEEASIAVLAPCGLRMASNNMAGLRYKKVLSIDIPRVELRAMLFTSMDNQWIETARFVSSIALDSYGAPRGWIADADDQEQFIREQDTLSQRFTSVFESQKTSKSTKWKDGLFLRNVEPPQVAEQADRRTIVQSNFRPVNIGISGNIESDSDNERHISEVVRDERLAKTRPRIDGSLVLIEDEQASTTMDESDEAEDTECDTSESENFDMQGTFPSNRGPRLFCRRFKLLELPASEPQANFVLSDPVKSHERVFGKGRRLSAKGGGRWSVRNSEPPLEQDDSFDRAYLRVRAGETSLFAAPNCVPVVSAFLRASASETLRPELQIENILLQWIPSSQEEKQTVYDAHLQSFYLCVAIDIDAPEHPMQSHLSPGTRQQLNSSALAMIDLLVEGSGLFLNTHEYGESNDAHLPGSVESMRSGYITFQGATVLLSSARHPWKDKSIRVIHENEVMRGVLEFATFQLSDGKSQFSPRSMELRLSPTVSETTLLMSQALFDPLRSLAAEVVTARSQVRHSRKTLICTTLDLTKESLTKDILSTVQPSFFVQQGNPDRFRSDINWKLLFHLRHSVSDLSKVQYHEWTEALGKNGKASDIEATVESLHLPWVAEDVSKPDYARIIDSSFERGSQFSNSQDHDTFGTRPSISFQCSTLRFVMLGRSDGNDNSVTVENVELRVDSRSSPMLVDLVTITPNASTVRSFDPSQPLRYSSTTFLGETTVDAIHVTMYPSIIGFVEQSLQAWKAIGIPRLRLQPPQSTELAVPKADPTFFANHLVAVDFRFSLQHLLFEAAAENVVVELSSRYFTTHSSCHLSKPLNQASSLDVSATQTLGFKDLTLKARERRIGERSRDDRDTLAAFTLSSFACFSALQRRSPASTFLRSAIHFATAELRVPRSALRLYKFSEQWRSDYLLGFNLMFKSLMKEVKRNTSTQPKPRSSKPALTSFSVDIAATQMSVVLQIMHGTWLSWTLNEASAYIKSDPLAAGAPTYSGVHLSSQSIRIATTAPSEGLDSSQTSPKIVLQLPSIDASITDSKQSTDMLLAVGLLQVTIKPSHWDSLLSVQQKFGQDFNDLLALIGDNRQVRLRRPSTSTRPVTPRTTKATLAVAKFKGFKIGFDAPASTLFVECFDMDASVSRGKNPNWKLALLNLNFYLRPLSIKRDASLLSDRRQMPLLVSIDLSVLKNMNGVDDKAVPKLDVAVTRLHGILQAHLLGDIGDFIDHLQSEVMLRRERRAAELAGFRTKARKVMETFDLNPKKDSVTRQEQFFTRNAINVSMSNFGVAFPLNMHAQNTDKGHGLGMAATRALLLSVRAFKFSSQKSETGQATTRSFCLQFVPRFNASDPRDYLADNHQTLNQLEYPEMTVQLRTETSSSLRHFSVTSAISGFVLDLDPSITVYAFAVMDAYKLGMQRVERLTAMMPRPPLESDHEDRARHQVERLKQNVSVVSDLEASLRFGSGLVRMHPSEPSLAWSREPVPLFESQPEEFLLPELSVLTEYHSTLSVGSKQGNRSPTLVFESTVHSSHNILRPPLLTFITGVVHNIEERMKKGAQDTLKPIVEDRPMSLSPSAETNDTSSIFAASDTHPMDFQLFMSLRIDKSRLDLTCKPDANVVAGLNWESGGFILNTGPNATGISISASIEGLDISLKHGFLSENSAHIDAKNLNFSINFSKAVAEASRVVNFISIAVDTEFEGGMQFSRLQDFMCFKAVWLDHIPLLSSEIGETTSSPSKLSMVSQDTTPKQAFDTAIIVQVRQIILQVDLGQSISVVSFDLLSALVRARITSEYEELSFQFAKVGLNAQGNLSGHLHMPDFMFRTMRRRKLINAEKTFNRMLELSLTSGPLEVQLQSDWLWLLQYRAEPLKAVVYDQWTLTGPSESMCDRRLGFFFSVTGSKVIAMMTIMAIPKLVMYAGKFRANLEAQREGAARESFAFRVKRLPKPENALSEVANAMFQTARSKLKETESLSYVIGQHMKLRLSELCFIVLPRSQGDTELARFIGRDVMAQLHRTVEPNGEASHRDLQLSLSRIAISQIIKQGFDPRLPNQEFDVLTAGSKFSGTENVIFSLPAMDMRMISDEMAGEGCKIIAYDFVSNFVRQEGTRGDNISISLNISLYSWLTFLRRTFSKELKRVQDVAGWRTGMTSPSVPVPRMASLNTSNQSGSYVFEELSPALGSAVAGSRSGSPARSRSMESKLPTVKGQRQHWDLPPLLIDSLTEPQRSGTSDDAPVSTRSHARQSSASVSGDGSEKSAPPDSAGPSKKGKEIVYNVRTRKIERLTVRQLGEATPDVMHPFFTRRAGFNLEESLPQYVHEYATLPIEEIMKALLKVYSKQLS